MSKRWGYVCQSHDPEITSDTWLNHGADVLAEAYRRERGGEWPDDRAWSAQWPDLDAKPAPIEHNGEEWQGGIHWLREHPRCVVALRSEYGEIRPLMAAPVTCCGQPRDDEGRCVHRPHHPQAAVVMAHTIPFTSQETDPLDAIRTLVALDSRDWTQDRADAWLYGIVLGWDGADDDPEDVGVMDLASARHGWNPAQVARLRALHERFKATLSPAPDTVI